MRSRHRADRRAGERAAAGAEARADRMRAGLAGDRIGIQVGFGIGDQRDCSDRCACVRGSDRGGWCSPWFRSQWIVVMRAAAAGRIRYGVPAIV